MQFDDCVRECRRVVRTHQQTGFAVTYDFFMAAVIRSNDRCAAEHRFHQRSAVGRHSPPANHERVAPHDPRFNGESRPHEDAMRSQVKFPDLGIDTITLALYSRVSIQFGRTSEKDTSSPKRSRNRAAVSTNIKGLLPTS